MKPKKRTERLEARRAEYDKQDYDGTHRMMLAVSKWASALANEGDRGE